MFNVQSKTDRKSV